MTCYKLPVRSALEGKAIFRTRRPLLPASSSCNSSGFPEEKSSLNAVFCKHTCRQPFTQKSPPKGAGQGPVIANAENGPAPIPCCLTYLTVLSAPKSRHRLTVARTAWHRGDAYNDSCDSALQAWMPPLYLKQASGGIPIVSRLPAPSHRPDRSPASR